MLRLENVQKMNNMIYAGFFFVGDSVRGTVTYDIGKKQVIDAEYGGKNPLKDFIYGFGYVKMLLDMMVEADNYPAEVTYEWY